VSGYISLHRKIRDHWIWENPLYLKWWLDLLMMANYKPTKILLNRMPQMMEIGEHHTSEIKLSARWDANRKTVDKFLKLLEKDEMITLKKSKQNGTTINIRNYQAYQDVLRSARDNETDNGMGNELDIKNKENKENNTFSSAQVPDGESSEDENKPPLPPPSSPKRTYEHDSAFYKAAKWLANDIEQSTPGYKQHTESQLQKWANEARLMMERDKRDPNTTSILLQFARADKFWSKNILSMGTFREKYDTLLVRYNEQNGGDEAC